MEKKVSRVEEVEKLLSEKQETVSHLEQDLSNYRLDLTEKEKKINETLQVEVHHKILCSKIRFG